MITVKDIDAALSATAPRTLSEEWDNDGVMLCRRMDKPVKKALVMLEVTPEGIAAAEKGGYDQMCIRDRSRSRFRRLSLSTGFSKTFFPQASRFSSIKCSRFPRLPMRRSRKRN